MVIDEKDDNNGDGDNFALSNVPFMVGVLILLFNTLSEEY